MPTPCEPEDWLKIRAGGSPNEGPESGSVLHLLGSIFAIKIEIVNKVGLVCFQYSVCILYQVGGKSVLINYKQNICL